MIFCISAWSSVRCVGGAFGTGGSHFDGGVNESGSGSGEDGRSPPNAGDDDEVLVLATKKVAFVATPLILRTTPPASVAAVALENVLELPLLFWAAAAAVLECLQ